MNGKPVLLIDSKCTLCSKTMNFIVRHGGEDKFQFLSLYSDAGRQILKKHGFPEHYDKSVVLVENGTAYSKSDAALRTTRKLNGFLPMIYGLKIIPKKFRDWVYDLIARHRHRFFNH